MMAAEMPGFVRSVRKSDKKAERRLKTFPFLSIYSDSSWDVKMEIAPIPGIRALPAVRAVQAEIRPPAIFDIDASARPGDGEERRGGRKAAGAEESDEEELALDAETADEAESLEAAPSKQVDYFA
jgi:hypothetical protein